jgi:hypothetical protein
MMLRKIPELTEMDRQELLLHGIDSTEALWSMVRHDPQFFNKLKTDQDDARKLLVLTVVHLAEDDYHTIRREWHSGRALELVVMIVAILIFLLCIVLLGFIW